MATIYEDECREAKIDPDEVRRIASRLQRVARDAKKAGILIFGGSGSATLRPCQDHGESKRRGLHCGRLILTDIEGGSWDGGDGGYGPDADGLMRGE